MIHRPQDAKAAKRLVALKSERGAWRAVAEHLGANVGEVHGVATGKRRASRRLLVALGIVKPEKRAGIRVRISISDAREIVDYNHVPIDVVNRMRWQMGGKR